LDAVEYTRIPTRRGRLLPALSAGSEAWFAPVTICLVATVLGAALRLYHLGETPAWRDETVVYWLGQETLGRLLSRDLALTGTHPPLFYIVHWGWNYLTGLFGIGPSAIAVRMPSVIIGTASIPLFYVMFRNGFGQRVAAAGAVFLAVSPAHLAFSRTAKSEILVVFLLIPTLGFAVRLLDRLADLRDARADVWTVWRDRGFVAFAVCYILSAILMLHTHSLGCMGLFSPSFLFVVQFLRRKQGLAAVAIWAVINLIVVAAFLPWLNLLMEISKAGTGYWWLRPLDSIQVVMGLLHLLIDLPEPPGAAIDDRALLAVGLLTTDLIIVGCVRAMCSGARRAGIAVALLSVPAILFAISQAKPVFWGYMLTAFSLPLLALVAGFALEARTAPRRTQALLVALMVAFTLPADQYVYGGTPEAWDKVAAYLGERIEPDDPVLFWPPLGEWSTRFYGLHATEGWRTIDLGPNVDFQPLQTVPAMPIADVPSFVRNAHRLWLVTDERWVPDVHALPDLRTTLSGRMTLLSRVQFGSGLTVFAFDAQTAVNSD
jgi:hypothetical protein